MQIKDIEIIFKGQSLSKYGLFALLAWFLVDVLNLEKRFRIVTVKRKRNRTTRKSFRKKPFSDAKLCIGIVTVILLGIKRFEKINNLLHTERAIAQLIGLERFFDRSTARNFINGFQAWHLRQLDRVNLSLLKDFGESTKQDFAILDIDGSTHSVESKRRQKAVPGYNKKNRGKPCYQWSVGFVREEVVSQRLREGNSHCSTDFQFIIEDASVKLGRQLIIRTDGGYCSAKSLNYLIDHQYQFSMTVSYSDITSQKENKLDESDWNIYDEKTKYLDLGMGKVVSKSPHLFRVILIEKEQESIKIKKRKKYYRYGIATNITFLKEATSIYEFHSERQTIENFFKESKNPFNSGKIPSQRFRANEAYLHLVAVSYNAFHIFKKIICHQSGMENLLKQLRIK